MRAGVRQALTWFSGLPIRWSTGNDVQLLLDAHEQGYYPGGKRKPRGPDGKGFVETYLTRRCSVVLVRALQTLGADL